MSDVVTQWIWIVVTVGVILLLVHPASQSKGVIEALSNQSVNNIKALQGSAPY